MASILCRPQCVKNGLEVNTEAEIRLLFAAVYISLQMWVVIAHPYLNPSISLSKPPSRLGRTWWSLWMRKLWLRCNNLITSKFRINLSTNMNPNLFQYQIKFERLIIARFFEVSKANHRLQGCQRNHKSCIDVNGYPWQELLGTNTYRRSECLSPANGSHSMVKVL